MALALQSFTLLTTRQVEYYPPVDNSDEPWEPEDDPDESPDSESSVEWHSHVLNKFGLGKSTSEAKATIKAKISDALAALGPYARSMKPGKNWLIQRKSSPIKFLLCL